MLKTCADSTVWLFIYLIMIKKCRTLVYLVSLQILKQPLNKRLKIRTKKLITKTNTILKVFQVGLIFKWNVVFTTRLKI